jgi:hypothetical protein
MHIHERLHQTKYEMCHVTAYLLTLNNNSPNIHPNKNMAHKLETTYVRRDVALLHNILLKQNSIKAMSVT